jgi:predicted ATP-dependent endonuclease of OLD family
VAFGLSHVRVRGFRSARDVSFEPAGLCALVGEARAGKSTLLNALWLLLQPQARSCDVEEGEARIRVEAVDGSGTRLSLESANGAPAALFLPASLRSSDVIAPAVPASDEARRVADLLAGAGAAEDTSEASRAIALVRGMEASCQSGVAGVVLLIEEPELFLRPQAQRYLYRLLRTFVEGGNQVFYSTHSPAFLNVARLEELAFVSHEPDVGTKVFQPQPLQADEGFRALGEFDAARSELLLSRAALLVEGLTEKLVFPFVFQALGYDADREEISIVECGGKPNIALFARVCAATGIPYVVVHDRDASEGREPIPSERAVNSLIAEIAGQERTVVLEPDFEAVAGLKGHRHKPERAWRVFSSIDRARLPEPLVRAAELTVSFSRR